MTREQMVKYSWKAYMKIWYKHDRLEDYVDCLLIEIDFDNELLTLQVIDEGYERKDFTTHIKFCHISKPVSKPTLVK